MSTKTTYICDSCRLDIIGDKTSGTITVTSGFGETNNHTRVFGNRDTHICDSCMKRIKEKYQDFINAIQMDEVKK